MADLFPSHRILIVTIREQVQEIRRQAPDVPIENFIIEPAARGTASVVGLAATVLAKRDPQAVMAVLPADHFIRNRDLFNYVLGEAFDVARDKYLVTLGITPSSASTAYGYIQQGEPLEGSRKYPVYHVRQFTEKPDEKTAQEFVRSRDHSWNSGMFIWRVDSILQEIRARMPELYAALEGISAAWGTSNQEQVLQAAWPGLKPETIDYGVMEHADRVVVLPAGGLGWSDVGSWDSLYEVLFPDIHGNVSTTPQHLALETHNTLVYGTDGERLIVTIGMDDTVVVDAGDVLLICKADQAQKVREVVAHLQRHRQEKYL